MVNLKYDVLWLELGDVPINDNEEIETPFLHLPINTHREDIWHWFEDTFNISVAKDLMYKTKEE